MVFEAQQVRGARYRSTGVSKRAFNQPPFAIHDFLPERETFPVVFLRLSRFPIGISKRFNYLASASDQSLTIRWILRTLQAIDGGVIDLNQISRWCLLTQLFNEAQ